ncbi:uncharacterized protein involved in propionate catabolism [Chthonomonas calidirosea]|uniref:MmgE/PrpD family protein n=1 Tax=Chthonomonas calidirosea TaxID=454171 RepID=UPI0006DD5001|nr:MmgE/PrpD family protein [Chthonomonas calidirosea]CEK19048.1 uncharacterized protein involved in propionate catabolism [Chthonomonas calidirosea]
MNLSQKLSRYADRLTYELLPSETVHAVKRHFIDTLGCALGAYDSEPASIARSVAGTVSSALPATVIGAGLSSSPEMAAFANGVAFRYLDYNDTYLSKEPAHPSDNFAAVLAIAEPMGRTGKDLIVAAVLAYEIQCRLCDAASIRARGWDHVTYGSFSTSLAAGKLLHLNEEQLTHAQAIAAVSHNALRQTRVGTLSHWKGCAFANVSRNGVFAAMLARHGMTGPSDIFEGEMGFWKQISGPFNLSLPDPPAPPFKIQDVCIKFYPAEYHSQSAIDAALLLRPQIGSIEAIEKITISTFRAAAEIIGSEPAKWHPTTRETADHSLPYCVAVALKEGRVTLDSFDAAHLNDPVLRELTQKIAVEVDSALDARYPEGIPNRLRIRLRNGQVLEKEVTFPKGHARNPLTDEEIEEKFRRLAAPVLSEERIAMVLKRCWNLENETDLSGLLALLTVENV